MKFCLFFCWSYTYILKVWWPYATHFVYLFNVTVHFTPSFIYVSPFDCLFLLQAIAERKNLLGQFRLWKKQKRKVFFRQLFFYCVELLKSSHPYLSQSLCKMFISFLPTVPSHALTIFIIINKYSTLLKKKIKFSSYIRKFRGIGCKVIYD